MPFKKICLVYLIKPELRVLYSWCSDICFTTCQMQFTYEFLNCHVENRCSEVNKPKWWWYPSNLCIFKCIFPFLSFFLQMKRWLVTRCWELLTAEILLASHPPTAAPWSSISNHQTSELFGHSNTMASALWRCPVFRCLLLLLVCCHCSQGEDTQMMHERKQF